MARKKKHKVRKKKKRPLDNPAVISWQGEDGQVHALVPGEPPSPEQLDEMTRMYQSQIRNSPLWDDMVKHFGLEKAEKLLKQCRAELK